MIVQPLRIAFALMLLGLPALLQTTAGAAPAEPEVITPQAEPLDAGTGFFFTEKPKKTRQSLSGIACPGISPAPALCLAVFDEGVEARYLTIEAGAIKPDQEVVSLIPGGGELDAEAAATDGQFYYVTGSHAAKRKDCKTNPASRHLIRLPIDPATGRARRDGEGKLVKTSDNGALWTLMASLPDLKDHVGDAMCLGTEPPEEAPNLKGKRGVNIEGLAVQDKRLFIGFRGPALDGTAKILSITAGTLFDGGDHGAKLTTIAVGEGRAVRDLLAVSDGLLVLAGPDDDSKNEGKDFVVLRWDGKDSGGAIVVPTPLAKLDLSGVKLRRCDDEIKPEGLAVLVDKPGERYQAVVFSDGMCDGGALRFSIPR